MKHITFSMFLVLLLLTACSGETTSGDAVVKQAKLTGFEKNLVDLTGDHSFVFDIELKSDEITGITGTIDYYKDGKLVRQIGGISTQIMEEDYGDTIRAVFIQQPKSKNQEQWITSIMTDGSQSSGNTLNDDIGAREKMDSASGEVSEAPLFIGEKKVLATIAYTNDEGITILNDIVTKEDLKTATDYEQVYVFSVELK